MRRDLNVKPGKARVRVTLPSIDIRLIGNYLPIGNVRKNIYGIVLLIYILLWPISRDVGGWAFFVVIFTAIISSFDAKRPTIVTPALLLSVLSVFYLLLSFGGMLPTSWTRHHENRVMLQQAIGYLTLPIFLLANGELVKKFLCLSDYVKLRCAFIYVALNVAIVPIVMSSHANSGVEDKGGIVQILMLNTFFSSELLLIVAIGFILFSIRAIWSVVISIALIPFCTNAQPIVALLVLMICRFGYINKVRLAISGASIFLASLVMMAVADKVIAFDVNTGIRAQFWKDGISTMIDTMGRGVGFGSEAIKPIYRFTSRLWRIDGTTDAYLLTGLHNSIMNAGFRMGVLGFGLMLWICVAIFPRRINSPFIAWLYLIVLLDLQINVALESVAFSLGLYLAIAGLAVLNSTTRVNSSQRERRIIRDTTSIRAAI